MIAKTLRYFFLVTLVVPSIVHAQFGSLLYRPKGLSYKVLRTEHFDIIHYAGQEGTARQTASILEENLPETQNLIGNHESFRLSVILNGYNDASNGFVTVLPFRSEIEVPAIRGKYLHSGNENWLEAVLPHELVHAIEIDHYKRNFLTRLFPEYSKLINVFRPQGFLEGIAVYRESSLHEGKVGRLNHSFFNMEYHAAMGSPLGWTLNQAIMPNYYGMPSGRHYFGGSHFVQFLAEEFGSSTYQRYSTSYAKRPYFGTAYALYKATGKWPYELNQLFRVKEMQVERRRLSKLGALSKPTLFENRIGVFHNNPIWLDNKSIVTYGKGYQDRPGFYIIDTETGKTDLLSHAQINEDHAFSFDEKSRELLWGEYNNVLNSPTQFISDINRLNIDTRQEVQVTHQKRVFTPIRGENGELWVTQNKGESSDWVEVLSDGETKTVCASGYGRILEILPRPRTEEVYVLLNAAGKQGVFKVNRSEKCTYEPVMLSGNGSVFDPSWSRDGRWMLFTADSTGVPNVYAWDTTTDQRLRVTNAPYGAYEASFSPDGRQVAFVWYSRERESIGVLPFNPEKLVPVNGFGKHGLTTNWASALQNMPIRPFEGGAEVSYKPLKNMRSFFLPVAVAPLDDKQGYGASLSSIDVLQRFRSNITGYIYDKKLWGSASLGTARLSFLPEFTLFNRPVQRKGDGLEEVGLGLSLRKPLIRKNGVFPVRADLTLAGFRRGLRPLRSDADYTGNTGVEASLSVVHKAQANIRDLRPNTGTILNLSGAWDKSTGEEKGLLSYVFSADRYIGYGKERNRSGKISVAYAAFNESGEHGLEALRILGYPNTPEGRHFLRVGADYLTPVWYIDRGMMTLPVHADVLYATAFANSVINTTAIGQRHTGFGLGLGLRMRLFRLLALDLQYNLVYKVQDQNFEWVFRSN